VESFADRLFIKYLKKDAEILLQRSSKIEVKKGRWFSVNSKESEREPIVVLHVGTKKAGDE